MKQKEYSAGMVKLSFWFAEFRKVVGLLNQGKTLPEIKQLNLRDNLFAAPTQTRAVQIFNTVSTRVKELDASFLALFEDCDISNQKFIVLLAIMRSDRLFFEFMYEVYREKLLLGMDTLADSDIAIFFKNKQLQSEKVAAWQDYTLKRLGTCYKTMLMEAGLLEHGVGARKILKPILDKSVEEYLTANSMDVLLHALTGVR